MTQYPVIVTQHATQAQWLPQLGLQGLGDPHQNSHPKKSPQQSQQDENGVPTQCQHGAAEQRSHQRGQGHGEDDDGHGPHHFIGAEQISQQRINHHGTGGAADSLQQSERNKTYRKDLFQKQTEVESSRKIVYLAIAALALALLLRIMVLTF